MTFIITPILKAVDLGNQRANIRTSFLLHSEKPA